MKWSHRRWLKNHLGAQQQLPLDLCRVGHIAATDGEAIARNWIRTADKSCPALDFSSIHADQNRRCFDDGVSGLALGELEFFGGIGRDGRGKLYAGSDLDDDQTADRAFFDRKDFTGENITCAEFHKI